MARTIPYIELSGSPRERGLAHGKAAAELIAKNVAFYKKLLKLEDDILLPASERFAEKIRTFRPAFVEEMDGIAEGSGVEPAYIYMINARTELLAMEDTVQSECATFFFPASGILFENWDWSEPSKELTVLLHITLEDGRRILTFTEAGMLGKVGLSSAGFGIAFNYLYPAGSLNGLPIHALLRALLECASYEEASGLLAAHHPGSSGNILIGAASGKGADYELSGLHTDVLPVNGSYLFHTNHYLGGFENDAAAGKGFLDNSFDRYAHAQGLLEHADSQDVETAKRILADRAAGNGMICRDFIPEAPGHIPTGTIASIVMELREKKMHIALDPQESGAYSTFSL